MISVENIIHYYSDKRILDNVSFTQDTGTVTAIIGPSGSGKTTLLRTLNALTMPKSGIIQINDQRFDTAQHTKKDILRLRQSSAMVFQNYNLLKIKQLSTILPRDWCMVRRNRRKKRATSHVTISNA